MDLDDQLAALAAGELDDDEARALRARVAADPALARRLARVQQLDRLLATWEVPPMGPEQLAALDDAVTEALDALDDRPLTERGANVVGLDGRRAAHQDRRQERSATVGAASGAAAAADGDVVDLGTARERRGLPAWAGGLAVAAAAVAVVGTVGLSLTGVGGEADSADDAAVATSGLEDAGGGDAAEESAASEEAMEEEMAEEDTAGSAAADEAAGDEDAAGDGAAPLLAPRVEDGLELADREDLVALAEGIPLELYTGLGETTDDAEDAEGAAVERLPAAARACIQDVLAATSPERATALVGSGTYEGDDVVVIVRASVRDGDVVATTQVYDVATCELVDEVVNNR